MNVATWVLAGMVGYACIGAATYVIMAGVFDLDEGADVASIAAVLWPLGVPFIAILTIAVRLAKKVKAARLAREERRRSSAAEREAKEREAAAEAASRPPFR